MGLSFRMKCFVKNLFVVQYNKSLYNFFYRTESVVEKLLANWLSLCMYRYLRETAGSSLYTLYQAIKVQVDKGPVDCFTCEARYSLSEDRLLRTEKQLEYSVLVLIHKQ